MHVCGHPRAFRSFNWRFTPFCGLLHWVESVYGIRSIPGCFRSDIVGVMHVCGHPRAVRSFNWRFTPFCGLYTGWSLIMCIRPSNGWFGSDNVGILSISGVQGLFKPLFDVLR